MSYKIKFIKKWGDFKKNEETSKYSRDISKIFVNRLKVAVYVDSEDVAKE